jgi:hypothetical protein
MKLYTPPSRLTPCGLDVRSGPPRSGWLSPPR